MKKLMLVISIVSILGCNDGNENMVNNKDPNRVHPETEAVPDSLKIVNDSVVVPDNQQHQDSASAEKH